MWRSVYCAIGIAALILGAEFLVIERATLTLPPENGAPSNSLLSGFQQTVHSREFIPPEWAPWTLISFGAVTVLYATSVARE
jgi:hypothetical protein